MHSMAERFLRLSRGPMKWLVDEIWRVEAEY